MNAIAAGPGTAAGLVLTAAVALVGCARLTRPPARGRAAPFLGPARRSRRYLRVGHGCRPNPSVADGSGGAAASGARRRVGWSDVAVVLAAIAITATLGPLLAAALLVARCVVLPRWRALRAPRRRLQRLHTDLPDVIDVLVALVGASLTTQQAVDVVAQRGPVTWRAPLAAVVEAQRSGVRFADALDTLLVSVGPPARPIVDALSSAERYGHPLAPLLERLAADGRAMRRRHAEIAARQLPVRLSFPLVCCTLPSFVLLAIAPLIAGALTSISIGGPP